METFYNPPSLILGPIVLNCKPFSKLTTLTVKVITRNENCLYQSTQDIRKVEGVVIFEQSKKWVHLKGDVKLEFYLRDIFSKNNLLMSLWFNTFFVQSNFGDEQSPPCNEIVFKKSSSEKINFKYSLKHKKTTLLYAEQSNHFSIENSNQFEWINSPKNSIDRINKDVGCKIFPEDFEIYVGFIKKEYVDGPSPQRQNDPDLVPSPNDNQPTSSVSLLNVDRQDQCEVNLELPTSSDSIDLSDLSEN